MIIRIIHKEWSDNLILDFTRNILKRESIDDEYGTFYLKNNIIFVKWHKLDEEIFICHFDDNKYYLSYEINFVHIDWNDECYIDYINNILYRKSTLQKGTFEMNDKDEMLITWEYNGIVDSKIPNIIHFVFGLKEQKEEFELYRYIAIKSAYEVNKPDKMYFHYHYEPFGYYWDKIKPLLTLNKVELPNEIYGNQIYHYAHKADIIRLHKLIEYGGIYLDIDTICLKSFNDLLYYDFVMGEQTNMDNTNIYGLCNAVILSKPNSNFGLKWLESYKDFKSKGRDEFWDEHSVLIPLELSKTNVKDIKIMSHNTFFYPLWYHIKDILFSENYVSDEYCKDEYCKEEYHKEECRKDEYRKEEYRKDEYRKDEYCKDEYRKDEYKKFMLNSYCIHLWDTYSHTTLKKLTEDDIIHKNTLYNIFSRKFIRNNISIVFLTYNRLEATKRCLDSYLKCLDNKNIIEMIILDNNSNNDCIQYLKELQEKHNKIKLILSNENLGVCGGRTVLFQEALGDIIISLDSDAYLINNSFFDKIIDLLYDERYGIVGISGAFINTWEFGKQEDVSEKETREFSVDHIAGCCQAFRRDLFHFGFKLDPYYDKFWVEDTDLSMQSIELNKINFKINQSLYIDHHWGGSGKEFQDKFLTHWNYFSNKWKGKVLKHIK